MPRGRYSIIQLVFGVRKEQMKATKILNSEIEPICVASLPVRPTASRELGGLGYSSSELKAAFDRLPLFIIERFNALLDDISDGSLTAQIPTNISPSHSLANMLEDIKCGNFASYLSLGDVSLLSVIADIRERLSALEEGRK